MVNRRLFLQVLFLLFAAILVFVLFATMASRVNDIAYIAGSLHDIEQRYKDIPYEWGAKAAVEKAIAKQLNHMLKSEISLEVTEIEPPALLDDGTTYVSRYYVKLMQADESSAVEIVFRQVKRNP